MAHDHDREVIVSEGGSGATMLLGVIIVVALLFGIWFFALGPGQGAFSGTGTQPDVKVDVNLPTAAPAGS